MGASRESSQQAATVAWWAVAVAMLRSGQLWRQCPAAGPADGRQVRDDIQGGMKRDSQDSDYSN